MKPHLVPLFTTGLMSLNVVALISPMMCDGRPSTATTEDNISVVRRMIEADKRVTYQQIRASLLIENRKTVTAEWYSNNCLPRVLEKVREKRPPSRILLHQDNASSHTARQTIDYLATSDVELLGHPTYSHNLAPCDFYLFRKIKEKLRGKRFMNAEEAVATFQKVSDDIGYVIYSALGSFYIPSCIMVFVYIRIYFAAKARARRGIRKNPRPRPNEQQTSFTNPPRGTRPMPATHPMPAGHINTNNNGETQIATIETPQVQIPTVTCDLASDISTSEAGDTVPPPPDERKDTLKVVTSAQVTKNPLASCPLRSSTLSVNGELQLQQTRGRAPSMAIDADMVSELEPSSSDSGVVSRCGGVKPLKLRIFKKSDRKQEKSQPSRSELEPALPKPHKPRDPEREKKRLARKKEKRATLILGLIMGSFIACWLPFFFLYILKAACRQCVIPPNAFAIAFWLGYMNSVLNPVIYTIFNKDFRRAFRRILFK
ncbi:alpha-2B adrenergic receptor [Galleria mellonella]|uniref:Alpha-2B adrenergic receptor n=1 Tax=Galleria mellonella TaxID=7137 RepID=A0ABM3MIL7_GALME|nr:alpha-2B adrenergic receptor [Galleria mellonella]